MSLEDKQKAITDIEGQIKEIEERKCETPEEVEARNADLEKAASQFEGAINELKEVRRLEELRTQANEVRQELSLAGTVAPAPKKEVRAVRSWEPKPNKCFRSRDEAIIVVPYFLVLVPYFLVVVVRYHFLVVVVRYHFLVLVRYHFLVLVRYHFLVVVVRYHFLVVFR